jgi:hypothetical protein
MTNGNDVTHNTKHTIVFNKTKFTPYSVPPAHTPASVSVCLLSVWYMVTLFCYVFFAEDFKGVWKHSHLTIVF